MNNILMQLKIEHSKLENEIKELNIKTSRLLSEISLKACPFYEDIKDIDTQGIKQAAQELVEIQQKTIEVQNKLKKINLELDND